jgi:hypothetical protein
METDTGRAPEASELVLLSAAQLVISELNARLKRCHVEARSTNTPMTLSPTRLCPASGKHLHQAGSVGYNF